MDEQSTDDMQARIEFEKRWEAERKSDPLYRDLLSTVEDVMAEPPLGRPLHESIAKAVYDITKAREGNRL